VASRNFSFFIITRGLPMKKWMLLTIALTLGTLAGAQSRPPRTDDLRRLSNRVYEMIERNADRLDRRDIGDITAHLEAIRDIIRGGNQPPVPPTPAGMNYCVAACITSAGNPDLRYARGMKAEFEVQAKQLAIEATMKAFSCNIRATIVACENQSWERYDALASCIRSSGNVDTKYTKLGTGNGPEEAQQNARQSTMEKYSCNIGVKAHQVAAADGRHYCSAACINSSGNPDVRYSKGADGDSTIEASAKAIELVMNTYNCNIGVKITECSQ
jgi:hypothetical protein